MRKPHWERLEALVTQCGSGGTAKLGRSDLREFGLLYRQVAADLSILRQDATGTHYARRLNQLLGRAHSIIYTGKKTSLRSILAFFAEDWPALVRKMQPYLAVVASVFVLCGMAGVLLTLRNADFALQVLGPGMMDSIERHQMWTQSIVGMKPLASGAIMTNNLAVCFMTFAMGVTAGLGTLYMIAFNGLLMGVVGAACGTHGMSLSLWSFVAGHGSLEIPAIFFAGAAGLRLGAGLLFPGNLTRRESIRVAGSEAVKLELGTVPLLVVAGLVEGFISPLEINPALKFALGAALFTALLVWVFSRQPEQMQPQIGAGMEDIASQVIAEKHRREPGAPVSSGRHQREI
ncbi:MAG: stage II sporulation protein M [Candidatus Korobacteraceae bacterium]